LMGIRIRIRVLHFSLMRIRISNAACKATNF
jgi:hypothetical protein